MSLLLIENHEPFTRILRQALEEEGHAVEVARDAQTGDRKAWAIDPDVILLDLVRFKSDGLSLLHRWRKAGLRSHVLAFIAPGDCQEPFSSPEMAADDYLTVPFALEELFARLRDVVSLRPVNQTPGDNVAPALIADPNEVECIQGVESRSV